MAKSTGYIGFAGEELRVNARKATSDDKPTMHLSGFLSPTKRGNRRGLIVRTGRLTGIDEVKSEKRTSGDCNRSPLGFYCFFSKMS